MYVFSVLSLCSKFYFSRKINITFVNINLLACLARLLQVCMRYFIIFVFVARVLLVSQRLWLHNSNSKLYYMV